MESSSTINGSTQIMSAVVPERGFHMEDDDMIDDPKPENNRKKALIIGLAMILVVVLGAFIGDRVFGGNSNKPPVVQEEVDVEVPVLKDLMKDEADALLKEKGLVLEVQSTEPSDLPVDTVIKSIPESGQMVKKGSTVAVILSAGKEEKLVPDITGITTDTARMILENNGFNLGQVSEENDDLIPEGEIISQDPAVNTSLPKGSAVNVLVSKGAEVKVANMPSLIAKTEREAKGLLESKGLILGEVKKIPIGDETKNGRIVEQSIPENTEIKEGTKINVSIYEYKEITIPSGLIEKNAGVVFDQLKALGLNPKLGSGTQRDFLVVEVTPGSGSLVPYGGTVTILGDPEPEEEPIPDPVETP